MPTPSRTAAQERADDIQVFRRELQQLELDGVIQLSAAQHTDLSVYHDELLSQYAQTLDIDPSQQARQLTLGMRIASLLGALALAASVFFLFYQFWGKYSSTMQLMLLMSASLVSFAMTVYINGKDASGYFTKLAAMVAFVCFVLNVAILGQIYNIQPTDKALLLWAGYALFLAYSFELRLLLAAGILCIIAYISARTGTIGGMYWLDFGLRPENFFPAAAALFLIPQLVSQQRFPGFSAIYRVYALLSFFLPVLVLANWGQASYLDLDRKLIEGFYQLTGFCASASLIWLALRRNWPETVNTCVSFFILFLYTKFFDWWWNSMPKYLFFLLLGLISVLLLFILRRLRTASIELIPEHKP